MNIKIFGYRGPFNSTERIEDEFKKLGHKITDKDVDLLIHLTGPFDEAQRFYAESYIKPVRMYCLLDIDPLKHISWYDQVKTDLNNCEIPIAISNTVANQIKNLLGVKKDIKVIHYPIRPISYLCWQKGIEFLWSGRLYSSNKRFGLAVEALKTAGFDPDNLAVVGTEKPPIGLYIERPDDELLNEVFNSSRFLISPSLFEGQNCNMIQAVISHTYPVLTNDCEVVKELGLNKFSADPDSMSLAKKMHEILGNQSYYNDILNELRPGFIQKFSVKYIVERFIQEYEKFNYDVPF